MEANGLRSFSFHRHDAPKVAAALGPAAGPRPRALDARSRVALDPETAARDYLAAAFASDRLPGLTAVEVGGHQAELASLGAETLPLTGTTVVKFRQQLRHVPVYGSLVSVELGEGNELLAIRSALGDPHGVSPLANVSAAQAIEIVAHDAGYPGATLDAVPVLHFYFDGVHQRWHLAHIVENVLRRDDGTGRAPELFDYVLDAHTGSIVAKLPRTQSVVTRLVGPLTDGLPPALARDELGRERQFRCKPDGERKVLVDEELGVHTHDFAFRDLVRDERALPGDYVSLPPEPWSTAGVSAHANAVEVARFVRDVLMRNGLDNRGGPLVSSINCLYRGEGSGREWRNAAWIGTQMVYGQRRSGDHLVSYSAALDVVAHEMLHGLTDHTARLEYAGASGALNESYSDIFGVIVSNFAEPDVGRWNWQMGEELDDTGVPIRDLASPSRHGQPEHMRDYRDLPLDALHDWGGVHINSGIHNRAAYLVLTSVGAQGRRVFAPREVAAMFYVALGQYLSRTSRFVDSRRGVELAARTLFRSDPTLGEKLDAIARAFDEVGILRGSPEATGAVLSDTEEPALDELARISVAPSIVVPYDPDFLQGGFRVPLPTLGARLRGEALDDGRVVDYVHYSLAMSVRRRVALFTACNIDAAKMVRLGRENLPWMLDPRVPASAQLGPAYYASNVWDRGHLVRRQDPIWGSVRIAREANAATFYFTNAAPQHENFNQDEWLVLEDWVLERATDFSYRLCVFTGPVLRDDDPSLRDAQIPAGFWKVIVLRDATAEGDDLSAVAFFMKQTEMSDDKLGRELLLLQRYQVTLSAIEEWTGLDLGTLKNADELAWAPPTLRGITPAIRHITRPEDIVFSGASRRAAGARVRPIAPSEGSWSSTAPALAE